MDPAGLPDSPEEGGDRKNDIMRMSTRASLFLTDDQTNTIKLTPLSI